MMPPTLPQPSNGFRVAVRDGRLCFNGRAVVPFGGELQYFRVRDPGGDPRRTHEMWAETLDRMAEAGLNLVSTYVPWDYHEPAPGRFDFAGDRDFELLLEMIWKRGLMACVKPGPFITAEWPRGFGTFGAVPDWFRARHPDAMVRRPGGGAWSFHPLGDRDQAQPAYDHPRFREAVKRWFAALAPLLRRYIHDRPAIAMLQLDNETNLFWSGLDHIEGHADYARRHDHCCDYLSDLKAMWGEAGIGDRDVLFSVNDSPFPIPGRHTLLPDTPRKSTIALHTLDTYPRALPLPARFADQPFQAPYFTKMFARRGYAFAAEIQAMELKFLLGVRSKCAPGVMGHHLAQLFGSGLRGGVMYVIREGLNADGTLYGPGAPLSLHGHATARWDVIRAFAGFLKTHGEALAAAPERARLAVVTHPAHASDPEERGRLWAIEAPAIFGWLRMAGFDPAVVDLSEAADLSPYAGLACIRPDLFPPEARAKLDAAAARGVPVVAFSCGVEPRLVGPMLPGAEDGITAMPSLEARFSLRGASGTLRAWRDRRRLDPGGDVFLTDAAGAPLAAAQGGWFRFATRLATPFNRGDFYDLPDSELLALRALARAIFGAPDLDADPPQIEAWRRGPFVFVLNHGPATLARLRGVGPSADAVTGARVDPAALALDEYGLHILLESV